MLLDPNRSPLSLVPLLVQAAVACLLFAAPAIAEPVCTENLIRID
jgi:hypothetical protein